MRVIGVYWMYKKNIINNSSRVTSCQENALTINCPSHLQKHAVYFTTKL